jgi:hypothetical protein
MSLREERRRHTRYPFERHLEVRAPAPYGKMVVRAHDISASGFSFVTEAQLQIGDHIVLGLRNDEDLLIEATIRSVRSEGDGWLVGAERINGSASTL